VNVATGRRTQIVSADTEASVRLFDREGQMRLAGVVEGKEEVFKIRARNDQPWRPIKSFALMNVRWAVQTLLADGHTAYVIDTTTEDRGVLRPLDLDTGNMGDVVFNPPAGAIKSLILSPGRERLLGVVYEDEKFHTHWIDDRWGKIGRTLQSQFPQHTVAVVSISQDEKRFIFLASSDRDPGSYFLADLRGEGLRVQPITGARPAIKAAVMSPTEPVQFTARDGLTIHGYLTKPAGRVDAHTPLLVMPHGGPFGIRDSWVFNSEIQFLANRGYAVLQVNYRGSGGYGVAFEHAGYREWAGKMQDDLTDAVGWVLARGWADRARVGIMGASYGGYAALVGVTMTPELYQVGINYVGVSDLRLITRWDLGHDQFGRAFYEQAIGRDADFLAQHSPIEHVASIRVPTLHAYGKNDPRVEFSHWEALERALKKQGKTYEFVVEEAEGHGFEKEDASLAFYHAVETFLDRYMPVDGLNPDSPAGPVKVVEPAAKAGH
jgi:dipeptidyl aminopeptidase/acylaminoacyl peptidase